MIAVDIPAECRPLVAPDPQVMRRAAGAPTIADGDRIVAAEWKRARKASRRVAAEHAKRFGCTADSGSTSQRKD